MMRRRLYQEGKNKTEKKQKKQKIAARHEYKKNIKIYKVYRV